MNAWQWKIQQRVNETKLIEGGCMSTNEYLTRLHMARESLSQAIQDLNQVDGMVAVKEELKNCASEIESEISELLSLEEV